MDEPRFGDEPVMHHSMIASAYCWREDGPEDVAMDVSVVQRSLSDLWRLKDGLYEQEQAARAFWAGMTDDERLAATGLVTSALRRLIDQPEVWLPSTITPQGGDRIDVTISLQLPDTTQATIKRLARSARSRDEMIASLRAILEDDESSSS